MSWRSRVLGLSDRRSLASRRMRKVCVFTVLSKVAPSARRDHSSVLRPVSARSQFRHLPAIQNPGSDEAPRFTDGRVRPVVEIDSADYQYRLCELVSRADVMRLRYDRP
ncbi:hypothetical protein DENSPDRAFT_845579 [Dentipellis sp. KUC8613]|nr:hypothetical protein DENSPDRAFT_845579 [Dentipellis sp. KUC8613]